MSEQKHKKIGTNVVPTFKVSRKKSLQRLYQDVVLINFYETLSKKQKTNQMPFRSRKSIDIFHTGIASEQKSNQKSNVSEVTNQRKSPLNNKNVLLPTLKPKKQLLKFQEKLIANDTVFIHQRVAIKTNHQASLLNRKSQTKSPLVILQNPEIKLNSPKKSKLTRLSVASTQLLQDMAVVQMIIPKQKQEIDQSGKGLWSRVKSTQKLTESQNDKVYQYPIQNTKSGFKIKLDSKNQDTTGCHIQRNMSKFERTINFFRIKKKKEQQRFLNSQKNIIGQTYEQMQKINIKGQHTIYCIRQKQSKQKLRSKKAHSYLMPNIKYQNWKTKDLPFNDLFKAQVQKLFAYYLGLKEVTPIPSGHYKVYAADGNNGSLVARLLKNRGWWTATQDINEAHLVWTQHPQQQLMGKIQSNPIIQLKLQWPGNFMLPNNDIYSIEADNIKQFLKLKQNNFLQACTKLLHLIIYHKVITQFIERFKANRPVKGYIDLKNIVSHTQLVQPALRQQAKGTRIFNHCQNSQEIGDKKNLLFHIEKYCELNKLNKNKIIPQTKHICQEELTFLKNNLPNEEAITSMLQEFQQEEVLYILKPGQDSNRGNGITIHPNKSGLIQHISKSISNFPQNKTYIVQEYIDPLLYEGRKFDIRMWVLFVNNKLWFYRQGYIRTSCKEFTTKKMDKYIHLTNDAVQKYADEYGKYQPANKVSFNEMDKYLKAVYGYSGFYSQIYQKIKNLTKILFEAGMLVMGRHGQQFQLFGLDFLIDKKFNVWLIQCNKNPSIQICCSLLSRLVPNMLQNLISIAIDPHFPPNQRKVVRQESQWVSQKFNFQLLSDYTLQTSYQTKVKQDSAYLQYMRRINPFKLQFIASDKL